MRRCRASTTTRSPSPPDAHRVVVGKELYYEIQYGHRVGFVRAADVTLVGAAR